MAGRQWKLTVRHASTVRRTTCDSFDQAMAEIEGRVAEIRAEGPLAPVKSLREFEPGDRIHARLEVRAPGRIRAPKAGVDLMGDGRLVPYLGGVSRQEIEVQPGESEFSALAREFQARISGRSN